MSYKSSSSEFLKNNSLSGNELNSSSGVIFAASTHLSIRFSKFSSFKFEDETEVFFLFTKAVNDKPIFSDLSASSSFLFLKLTDSEIFFRTATSTSVAPFFLVLSIH